MYTEEYNMTSLNMYKYSIMSMCKYKGWDSCSIEKVWLLLTEEIGELAGSIRRKNNCFRDTKKIKIKDELGDVFSYLFQLAGMLDVDLDEMWKRNQNKSYNKTYFKDNNSYYTNESKCRKYIKNNSNRTENSRMV